MPFGRKLSLLLLGRLEEKGQLHVALQREKKTLLGVKSDVVLRRFVKGIGRAPAMSPCKRWTNKKRKTSA